MSRPRPRNAFNTDHGPFPHTAEHRTVEHYPEYKPCSLPAAGWWAEQRPGYLYHVGADTPPVPHPDDPVWTATPGDKINR